MKCPSCGAPIDVSGVFPGASIACASCGKSAIVGSLPPPPSKSSVPPPPVVHASTCPRCSHELTLRDSAGIVVSSCPEEHGLFISHASLREIQKVAARASLAAALDEGAGAPIAEPVGTEVTTLMCPRCRAPMTRRAYPHHQRVIVDTCSEHGTWFDAGELSAILLDKKRDAEAAAADAQALEKQAKATLDVSLALEAAREENTMRRGVEVAEDILDVVLGTPYRRRQGFDR